VKIGPGASVCAGAIILPGIEIGARALIGAGAVVNRDVPAGELWAGVPAHYVRKR
jgi:acetyltransferase-like isoleucine patch superfamily enzyme